MKFKQFLWCLLPWCCLCWLLLLMLLCIYIMWLFFVADGKYKAMIEVGKINLHWFGHKILKIKQLKLPASQLHKRLIQRGFETFHAALNSVSPLHWWNKYEGAWSSIRINIYPSMGWDFDGRVSLWLSERQTDVSSWRQQSARPMDNCVTMPPTASSSPDIFFQLHMNICTNNFTLWNILGRKTKTLAQ